MTSPDPQQQFQDDPMRNAPVVTGPGRANHTARPWQVVTTLIAAIVIVWVVLYGLSNQREEGQPSGGRDQQASTQITPNAPAPSGNGQPQQQGNQPGQQQQAAQPQPGAQPQSAQQPAQTGQANNGPPNRQTTGAGDRGNNNQNSNADQNETPPKSAGQNPAPNAQPPQNNNGQPAQPQQQ
jgi:hypothetical protein